MGRCDVTMENSQDVRSSKSATARDVLSDVRGAATSSVQCTSTGHQGNVVFFGLGRDALYGCIAPVAADIKRTSRDRGDRGSYLACSFKRRFPGACVLTTYLYGLVFLSLC